MKLCKQKTAVRPNSLSCSAPSRNLAAVNRVGPNSLLVVRYCTSAHPLNSATENSSETKFLVHVAHTRNSATVNSSQTLRLVPYSKKLCDRKQQWDQISLSSSAPQRNSAIVCQILDQLPIPMMHFHATPKADQNCQTNFKFLDSTSTKLCNRSHTKYLHI